MCHGVNGWRGFTQLPFEPHVSERESPSCVTQTQMSYELALT